MPIGDLFKPGASSADQPPGSFWGDWSKAQLVTPEEKQLFLERLTTVLNAVVPQSVQREYDAMKQDPIGYLKSVGKTPPNTSADMIYNLAAAMPIAFHGTPHEWAKKPITLEEFKNFPLPQAKPGNVIVYHRLSNPDDLESVLKEGLKTAKKKVGGEGPRGVIWGADTPTGYSTQGVVVGVEVPESQVYKTGNQFMVSGDIPPEAIKFVDKPNPVTGSRWHELRTGPHAGAAYEYLKEKGMLTEVPRPDITKVGTGQGAQSYGHGLYFAENLQTAKTYQEAFAQRANNPAAYKNLPESLSKLEFEEFGKLGQQMSKQGNLPEQSMSRWRELKSKKDIFDAAVEAQRPTGNMYQVNIPDEHVAKMLDWDKPLSEQAPSVKEALRKNWPLKGQDTFEAFLEDKSTTAGRLHDMISYNVTAGERAQTGKVGDQKAVADWLQSIGIPGIKYLDQGSRQAGQGTRNFVVFDTSIIKDVKKK